MDRGKVIKGIQECDLNGGRAGNCPYKDILFLLKEQEQTINDLTDIIRQLNQHIKDLSEYMTPYGKVKDVKAYAELLKEQEAKAPITDRLRNYRCPTCNAVLSGRFCHECGQEVKWE